MGGFAYANRYPLEHMVMSRLHGMGAGHMGGMGMGHMFKGVDTTPEEDLKVYRDVGTLATESVSNSKVVVPAECVTVNNSPS